MDDGTKMYTPDEIMALGMKCLMDNLGHVNAG
jgi:hypothetical protein